jgi:hypothetical protein
MSIIRYLRTAYWQDDFILTLTPEEKFFYIYLLTNGKVTQCGIYELSKKVIVFETGYNSETVEKLLEKFEKYGKIKYDDTQNEIFLVNWLKYNKSDSPKVKICIEEELKNVGNLDFLKEFVWFCIEYRYYIDIVSNGIYTLLHTNNKIIEKEKEYIKEYIALTLKRKSEQILFNFETSKWENITEEHISLWNKAYPACSITIELAKMKAWLLGAGAKGHKSNWNKFISGWLSRTQNKGGTKT